MNGSNHLVLYMYTRQTFRERRRERVRLEIPIRRLALTLTWECQHERPIVLPYEPAGTAAALRGRGGGGAPQRL